MTADVENKEGEMAFIQPVVTERVASKLRAGEKSPRREDRAIVQRRGQQRAHVGGSLCQFIAEDFLAFLERFECLPLLIPQSLPIQAGSDARAKKDRIEWLGHVIFRASLDAPGHVVLLIQR